MLHQKNIISCGVALFKKDEKVSILLVRPTKKNIWGIPKGKKNKDESYVECAYREVYEETGIIPTKLMHRLNNAHTEYTKNNLVIKKTLKAYAGLYNGSVEPIPADGENYDVKWFSLDYEKENFGLPKVHPYQFRLILQAIKSMQGT